jgi:hypothetical protein
MNAYHARTVEARKPRMPLWLSACAMLMLLVGLSAMPAIADEPAGTSGEDTWTFSVSPYLWAAGIKGKTATLPGLPAAKVDMRFSDIADDLQPSGMVFFTANRGRFGLAADLQYVQTEADSNDLRPLFGRERLRSTNLVLSGLATYRLIDDDRASLRLGGGLRYWSVETDLKLADGLLAGRGLRSDENWVDPLIGVSGTLNLAPKVFARAWAYFGGFGVGSDRTADLFVGVGYRMTDAISAELGYRWLKVDYSNDDFLYDVRQAGIASGLRFRF